MGDAKLDYANLNELIGNVKQAAIDAWMVDLHYTKIDDSTYEAEGSGAYGTRSTYDPRYLVTRPGNNGLGGGVMSRVTYAYGGSWSSGQSTEIVSSLEAEFDQIRTTIEELFEPWKDLPDPEKVKASVGDAVSAITELSVEYSSSGTQTDNTTSIAMQTDLVNDSLQYLAGATVDAFKLNFLTPMVGAAMTLRTIAVARAVVAAGEQSLWEKAREDVLQAATSIKDAFAAVAPHSSGMSAATTLDVAGWLNDAIGLIPLPWVGAVTGIVSIGIDILDKTATKDEMPNPVSGGSYEAVLTSAGEHLKKINSVITQAEQEIHDNLTANANGIRSAAGRSALDLVPHAFREGESIIPSTEVPHSANGMSEIAFTTEKVNGIVDVLLPAISTTFKNALDAFEGSFYSTINRDDRIGLGANGPAAAYADVSLLFYSLCGELSEEVSNAAINLKLAYQENLSLDGSYAADLRAVTEDIDNGTGYDPWNERPQPQPPYIPRTGEPIAW